MLRCNFPIYVKSIVIIIITITIIIIIIIIIIIDIMIIISVIIDFYGDYGMNLRKKKVNKMK